MASCREFVDKIKREDPLCRINCGNCVKYDRESGKCREEEELLLAYEDAPKFKEYKRLMEDSKSIVVT